MTSEAQKRAQDRYNKSKKGKANRKKFNATNYVWLKDKQSREGVCQFCSQEKWLIRKNPPTCRTCDRKAKSES